MIGADGYPTVLESTFTLPRPLTVATAFPSYPSGASSALATDFPSQITVGPGVIPVNPPFPGGNGITTCTSYTILGPDRQPTVIDTTWVVPGPPNTQTVQTYNPEDASNALPTGFPLPGPITASLGYPSQGVPAGGAGVTTCATYTYLGADGQPSVVESTYVVAGSNALPASPASTNVGFQSFVPQEPGVPQLPQGTPPVPIPSGAIVTTAVIIGSDGQPTPIVETVVVNTAGGPQPPQVTAGFPPTPPWGPVIQTSDLNTLVTNFPSPSDYDAGAQTPQAPAMSFPFPPVISGSGVVQASDADAGTVTGTHTSTFTLVTIPAGIPATTGDSGIPPSYGDNGAPAPVSAQLPSGLPGSPNGPTPSELTLWPASQVYGPVPATPDVSSPILQTSTWTNLIPEQTTTYTLNFPLTTLVTMTSPTPAPFRRVLRRQE